MRQWQPQRASMNRDRTGWVLEHADEQPADVIPQQL